MFDFDAGKIIIVGVIALIFIPPKDLPRVMRQVGQFVGKMRRMAADFQGQFMDAMRDADMADIRREAQKLAETARVETGFDTVRDLDRHMVAKPRLAEAAPPAAEATPAREPPTASKGESAVAPSSHSV